jgi:hypothetical protein
MPESGSMTVASVLRRLRDEARAAAARVGDRFRERVLVVSYPRSGSTLLRTYLSVLQGRPQTSIYPRDVVQPSGGPLTRNLDRFAFVKSHRLPPGPERIVYLVRDGRNAAISFLYLNYLSGGHRISRREELAAGLQLLSAQDDSWGVHVGRALERAKIADVLFVRYECLVRDPVAELCRILGFVGIELEAEVLPECVRLASARRAYFEQPLSGYTFEPEPGSIYDVLQRHRSEDYWRLLFDADCRRCFHEQGGTEALLHFGYETSESWWQSS